MAGKTDVLLSTAVSREADILRARQRAKQIAALLGFENQDQTRIATAVSEIARNAFDYAGSGRVDFAVEPAAKAAPALRITVTDSGPGISHLDSIWDGTFRSRNGMGLGLIGARRLMDDLEVRTGTGGTTVTLRKHLPPGAATVDPARIGAELAKVPLNPSDALHDQNQELLRLLHENRSRESELRVLNQELEETNRGVLVLYAELEDKARAVQEASESKQRFLSGVTHELRTPLNSIVSLTRLMLSHADGPLSAEQEKQANFIHRSAQTLTEMVNDLLDLARLEAGKANTTLTTFTVAELYAGLRGMFRSLAANPEVRLVFKIPERTLTLHTDEGKLAQILRNFISNALKFTERGSVTVSVEVEGTPAGTITFSVTDTGQGIAPEHHELVMQEWGQVPTEFQGGRLSHRGSGLGLPLSRSFAELLGGSVHFTSSLGAGSSFHVTLPALVRDEAAAPDAQQSPDTRPHILVADNNEVARYLLRRRLMAHTTAEVVEVGTGQEALEAVRLRRPQVLILDPELPDISGLELVRQLRADAGLAGLPLVLHLGRPLGVEEARLLEPFDVTVLPKQQGSSADPAAQQLAEEHDAAIERTLLQLGLSNMHQGPEA